MLDQIETEITRILDAVVVENNAVGLSSREWTRRIKDNLCALGQRSGFGVSASGCKHAETGEWLYDLVWAQGGAPKGISRTCR
jgi:hypothetical protein